MDLTDDGLALVANNGGIYFADESSVEKIGNSNPDEVVFSWSAEGVKSASSGSLLAWFAPTRPDPSLVAYDTRERRILAEVPIPGCGPNDCGSQPWSAIVSTGPHTIPIPSARGFNFVPGAP